MKLCIHGEIAFRKIFLGNTPISTAVRPLQRDLTAEGVFPLPPKWSPEIIFFHGNVPQTGAVKVA